MRICFTHDLVRSALFDDDDVNGRWLHGMLAPALVHLGHEVSRLGTRGDGADFIRVSPNSFVGLPGDTAASTWAAAFSSPEWTETIADAHAPLRGFDVVIGFELSPNQIRFLCAADIPYVDVSIDAVRFAPDLFLRMRTSSARFAQSLVGHAVTTEVLLPHVALLRSSVARATPTKSTRPSATLFVGQTDVDASLVCDGRLARVDASMDRIRVLAAGRDLLLKPHPHGVSHQDIRMLHQAFPTARIVTDNIYALLCSPVVDSVVTLSSGVAQEARLLGKPATCLLVPDNTRDMPTWYRVGLDVLHPDFWESLSTAAPLPRPVGQVLVAGELRRSLQEGWGYTAQPRLEDRKIAAGQSVSFRAGEDGSRLLTHGWAKPEPGGTWSVADPATLLVEVGDAGLTLLFECQVFVPRGGDPRMVTMSTRPFGPETSLTARSMRPCHLTLRLPPASGLVEISIHCSKGSSPKDLGLSDDDRQIGLQLIRLQAQPASRQAVLAPLSRGPLGRMVKIAASVAATVIQLTT